MEDTKKYAGSRQDLKNSIYDGVLFSAMTGLGDNFLSAAAVLGGAVEFQIGLLAAVPNLAGSIFQFIASPLLRKIGSRRTLVVAGVGLQAITWLIIAAIMFYPGELPFWALLAAYSLGFGLNLMINPAWSSWIADLVPESERARFFADRNRYVNLALFTATFLGGIFLRDIDLGFGQKAAFAIIFFIAFMARAFGMYFLSKTSEPEFKPALMHEVGLRHLFLLPSYKNELSVILFLSVMNFSAQIASPFFTPYMILDLKFDLGMVGAVTAIAIIMRTVTLRYWGKMIDAYGNRTVLVGCAIGASLVPAIWLMSNDFVHILVFNAFSGFVWGGFELASFNFLLASVSRELRASFMSKYNMFNGVMYAAGSFAGAILVSSLNGGIYWGLSAIPAIFMISTAMRLGTVAVFGARLPKKDLPGKQEDREIIVNILAVYPARGAMTAVMNGWNITHKAINTGTSSGLKLIYGIDSSAKAGRRIIYQIEHGALKEIERDAERGKTLLREIKEMGRADNAGKPGGKKA
ncbi:MAG: MFS transporter [Candidatus Micrarchaeia archaeon]